MEDSLKKAIKIIIRVAQPDKIILFGSRIKNRATLDSDYDLLILKKGVKAKDLDFDSKYPEIIKIFTEVRDNVLAKGWDEEAVIYSGHIRKYSELFDKEKTVRETEAKKDVKRKSMKSSKRLKERVLIQKN